VRFTNANITHAEPSSQEYRMDLAAPEMVRVAKGAYTYEYELRLRKEQDEGELRGELASLRETLSAISAGELESLSDGHGPGPEVEPQQAEEENADRVEEIRQSVTDKAVRERVERLGHDGEEGR
jgi:hypothetical protein